MPFRIIFMGSPNFACPSLEAIVSNGHEVISVVTQPDRPAGRGRHLKPPAVKELALKLGLDVLQPEKIKTDEFLGNMRAKKPGLFVVVAYGKILPQSLLDVPEKGSINVHASLLPKYRGAAPVAWAIINGDEVTGITTMMMDAGMDTGDVLLKKEVNILPADTAGSLHDRLASEGADLIVRTLEGLEADEIKPIKQNEEEAVYAPLLKKSDGKVNWSKSAREIHNHIRGMNPWPGAYTFLEGNMVKLHKSRTSEGHGPIENKHPGAVLDADNDDGLLVATGNGHIIITELQAAGGKKMKAGEFIRGHKMDNNTIFTSGENMEQ